MFELLSGNPGIHPGSIPSTGRRSSASGNSSNSQHQSGGTIINTQQYTTQNGVIPGLSSPLGNNLTHVLSGIPNVVSNQTLLAGGTPTSTQNVAQQQLIGGAISPSLLNVHHPQQPSQVSLETKNSSGTNNTQTQSSTNPNTSSGKPVIDAPMLSAMQQMFSTMDHQHTTPIYFN